MQFNVEIKNSNGSIINKLYTISQMALLKHLAFAGMGFIPTPLKYLRTQGIFLHFLFYLNYNDFINNKFSTPPSVFYDPTEKAQFSNLVGKALADFLTKQINNSFLTVNYESALKILNMPVNKSRPDLLAFSSNDIISIEAKGFSNGSGHMNKHKLQAQSGSINVRNSVACVSFNLYKGVKCKYHDPENSNFEYDKDLLFAISKQYYGGLIGFFDNELFDIRIINLDDTKFYKISLNMKNEKAIITTSAQTLFDFFNLLVPINMNKIIKKGFNKAINHKIINKENYYIDKDGLGIILKI